MFNDIWLLFCVRGLYLAVEKVNVFLEDIFHFEGQK